MTTLKSARAAWESAVRAWSRDDCKDVLVTMKLGEAMMYAATDLIVALKPLASSDDLAAGSRVTRQE